MMTNKDRLYLDLFTTALEGGIGYWSVCSEYHWQNDGEEDYAGFFAIVEDYEGPDVPIRIDREVIRKGISLFVNDYSWPRCRHWLLEAIQSNGDDGDFDADDADIIIQLGVFGEVRYG